MKDIKKLIVLTGLSIGMGIQWHAHYLVGGGVEGISFWLDIFPAILVWLYSGYLAVKD